MGKPELLQGKKLSILIPARNEMFLLRTVEDALAHKNPCTEVIVVLDGAWSDPGLPQLPDLKVIHTPKAIGQRAATNLAARLSKADFIMKLDAHCSLDQDFDLKLLQAAEELGPNIIQVPSQWNLHAFDWKCRNCPWVRDQGPTPENNPCGCVAPDYYRDMVWDRRKLTEAWKFDQDLKFGYWGELKDRQTKGVEPRPEFIETLSCLGACWFLSRDFYWHIGGMDEAHGSWGQMGTELACKAWLSGGKLLTNRRTWYAHMFRTQGGDFGFPYPLSMKEVDGARKHSHKLWKGGKWPLAIHDLKWLITKFWPIPGWSQEALDAL